MELPIRLSKESPEPIYHQIKKQIKALISSGHLPSGTALPSIRTLSKDLEISVITTRRAYQELEYEGFIKTIQGKGTFVSDIAEEKKEKVKMESVYKAIENAVEIALRHNYSLKEIEEMFYEVLKDVQERGG